MVNWKDNEDTITLRKCDIHAILMMISLGNIGAVEEAEKGLALMVKQK